MHSGSFLSTVTAFPRVPLEMAAGWWRVDYKFWRIHATVFCDSNRLLFRRRTEMSLFVKYFKEGVLKYFKISANFFEIFQSEIFHVPFMDGRWDTWRLYMTGFLHENVDVRACRQRRCTTVTSRKHSGSVDDCRTAVRPNQYQPPTTGCCLYQAGRCGGSRTQWCVREMSRETPAPAVGDETHRIRGRTPCAECHRNEDGELPERETSDDCRSLTSSRSATSSRLYRSLFLQCRLAVPTGRHFQPFPAVTTYG